MSVKNKNIVIIPARGGSKRFPFKNITIFNKLPLIVHSINYAKKNIQLLDKIVVSTDNNDIKKIALKNKVDVIDRPQAISGDFEPTVSALKHVLENVENDYENVILLQVTNPLRPKKLLEEAYRAYKRGNHDSLMTVSRNYHKLGKIVKDKFEPFNYKLGQRSQDLEPLYYENGLLYITKSELVLEEKIIGDNCLPFITNHEFSKVDIDTKEDLIYANYILKKYNE